MNTFAQTLTELRQGQAAHELTEQLADLVKCVRDTGRDLERPHKVLEQATLAEITTALPTLPIFTGPAPE